MNMEIAGLFRSRFFYYFCLEKASPDAGCFLQDKRCPLPPEAGLPVRVPEPDLHLLCGYHDWKDRGRIALSYKIQI